MRVFAVAKLCGFAGCNGQRRLGRRCVELLEEVLADDRVVERRMAKCLGRQFAAECLIRSAGRKRCDYALVVVRVCNNGNRRVILGGGAQHGRAADIDVLDGIGERCVCVRDSRLERVQIDDDDIDRLDAVLGHRRLIDTTAGEDAAMNVGMQRFDPPVHDFRETGDGGNIGDGDARRSQCAGAAAGRDNLVARAGERVTEIGEAVLVGDANERAFAGRHGRPVG